MTQKTPEDRPTALEALEMFKTIKAACNVNIQRSQLRKRGILSAIINIISSLGRLFRSRSSQMEDNNLTGNLKNKSKNEQKPKTTIPAEKRKVKEETSSNRRRVESNSGRRPKEDKARTTQRIRELKKGI